VARGIEVWASELASALRERGVDTTLFKGAGPAGANEVTVPCIRRASLAARAATALRLPGLWRTPLASPYALESFTFARRLAGHLGDAYDIVHMQDPLVAEYLLGAKKRGMIRAQVVLANGTEEEDEFLARFDCLQELDPYGLEQLRASGFDGPHWYCIPNFVDTERFRPGNRIEARRKLGLPEDAFVVLTVGAIQRQLKRMDYIIDEFSEFHGASPRSTCLLVAGALTGESDELIARGRRAFGDSLVVMTDLDHESMPVVYQAADVFVFAVTHGIYGIALAEAAATGLPCVVHDWKRVCWVAGPRAELADLERPHGLADALARLADCPDLVEIGRATRSFAERELSKTTVIDRYVGMYEDITNATTA